jgi:chorismate mutase/prephenate dehydratase
MERGPRSERRTKGFKICQHEGMSDQGLGDAEKSLKELERIDAELRELLEKRAQASLRRAQALAPAAKAPGGAEPKGGALLDPRAVSDVFRAVRAACAPLERPGQYAVGGGSGPGVRAAARARFGAGAQVIAFDSAALALAEVQRGQVAAAVVPYEMMPYGPVDETVRALVSADVRIVACFDQRENVNLVSKNGNPADIESIYATPEEHARAARFLAEHFPRARVVDVRHADMALELAQTDHGAAALAIPVFAEDAALATVHANVRDAGDDRVRYAVVSMRPSPKTGQDLTALVCSVSDSPGALHEVLRRLAEKEINLTKIESRPTGGDGWVYLFFLEIVGHITDRHVVAALDEVKRITKFFKVLGSYPRE